MMLFRFVLAYKTPDFCIYSFFERSRYDSNVRPMD